MSCINSAYLNFSISPFSLKLLLEHPWKCLTHRIQRKKVFTAFDVKEIVQIQEVACRSAENEAQVPQNVVYWSSTLRDVDEGNFLFAMVQPKTLEILLRRRISLTNSSMMITSRPHLRSVIRVSHDVIRVGKTLNFCSKHEKDRKATRQNYI